MSTEERPHLGGRLIRVADLVVDDQVLRPIQGTSSGTVVTERVLGIERIGSAEVAILLESGRHVGPADTWIEVPA